MNRETSNKSLNAINNVGLIPFLISFLEHRTRLPLSLVNAAGASNITFLGSPMILMISLAQCIYVLSDDNTPAIEALRADKSSHISTLLSIVQSDPATRPNAIDGKSSLGIDIVWHRVLVCGILENVSPIPAKATGGETVDLDKNVILPILTPLLNVSLRDASNAVEAIASQPVSLLWVSHSLQPSHILRSFSVPPRILRFPYIYKMSLGQTTSPLISLRWNGLKLS